MDTLLGHCVITYTDSDLISDEHQSELVMLANADRLISFRVGDIALEEIEDKSRRGIAVAHDRVDAAVGRFYGKKARTIRYYRETAAFFEQEVRVQYDMLPFSFFVFARSMNERWREVLEYAALNPSLRLDGLRIAFLGLSVASCEGQDGGVAASFSGEDGDLEADAGSTEMRGEQRPDKMWETSHLSNELLPRKFVAHTGLTVVNSFTAAIPEVATIVSSSSSLTDETKEGILYALDTIGRLMPEVIKSMV